LRAYPDLATPGWPPTGSAGHGRAVVVTPRKRSCRSQLLFSPVIYEANGDPRLATFGRCGSVEPVRPQSSTL
jgi:hypothetical protein